MSDLMLLGLPAYVTAGIVERLGARDICTLAQASKGCWQLAGLRTEIKTVFDAYKLGKQSESLLSFLTRHDNRVRTLSLTLRGTKTGPESVEGLAAQAEALQYLAGVVLACAPHLKALHIRGIYYSCIVELGNNSGTMCFGPLKNCFHTYLLAAVQQCTGLRLLELLTHNSWKVDGPVPLKTRETIITHLFKQLPKLKVLKWRETRNMVAALAGMQDGSKFSESFCASLAESSAPSCQLVEVFNSHGSFLPQLAGQGSLHGPKILAIEQSSPAQADVLPAKGLVQNLMAAPNLQELHLCTLHLLHPGVLRSALVNLRALRVLVLDYVEAYEKFACMSPELFNMQNNACVDNFSSEPCEILMPELEVLMLSKDALPHLSCLRCHKLVAFSGELESSTQVLTLQQYLPACAPSLQHMLLAAYVGMSGLESAIAALGPVVFACTQLQSLNVCLQDCPFSSSTSEYKQIALPMVTPGWHNLHHVAITCAPCLASWPGDSALQLAKTLGMELVTSQDCQLWPLLPQLKQVCLNLKWLTEGRRAWPALDASKGDGHKHGVGKLGFCQCDLDQFETMLLQQWWQKQRSRLQYAVASLSSM